MTWFKSDDRFPEHPKVDALEAHFGRSWQTLNLALATWHLLGCDCAARRTDGRFDLARAQRVVRAPGREVERALEGLVAVGLLTLDGGVYAYHDWAEYQPTKAQLDEERKATARRQSEWRKRHSTEKNAGRNGVSNGVTNGVSNAAPTRPVPTRPDPKQNPDPSRDPASAHEGSTLTETADQGTRDKGQEGPLGAEKVQTATGVADNPSNAPEWPSSFALKPPQKEPPKAPKPPKPPKAPKAPPPADAPPLVGTLAHRVYLALVGDRVLCPITVGPGDFASRIADPETYPGVDVLAEVRKAAEYASGSGKTYTDGRAYLRNWLNRRAQEVARQPRPAAPTIVAPPAPPPPVVPRSPPPTQEDLNRSAAAAREIGPKAQALFAKIAAEKGVRFGTR